MSSDSAYIISTLRKSSGNIIEVNSEGTAIRRSPDNPPPDIFSPDQRQKMKAKTVYVVGMLEGAWHPMRGLKDVWFSTILMCL